MSITEHKNTSELTDYQEVNIGKLYFFDNYVVGEFNEGVHIDFETFVESTEKILSYFGSNDFGFIANRTNSYSIDLNDANRFNKSFPNLKAYAVVCDTLFGKGVFEIENQFFKFNRQIFKNLDEAITWIGETL
ncbi:hypothetical protein [Winogradskyella haliclonae]|uniref:STAS/SEC14 domain-containing protein n=1 Tax=Winogradskyella haliclonae TaxID=2048558 RepID=A0ABQ2BZV3_9FLAO|nr:hypothetical protein [Winogradskyella haliclonae]GGI57806.1 hypothetical protein GCM10011444_21150 [Winogradskyella haliclonae]